jgi:hypothetical protein
LQWYLTPIGTNLQTGQNKLCIQTRDKLKRFRESKYMCYIAVNVTEWETSYSNHKLHFNTEKRTQKSPKRVHTGRCRGIGGPMHHDSVFESINKDVQK